MKKRTLISAAALMTAFSTASAFAVPEADTPYFGYDITRQLWGSYITYDETGEPYVSVLEYKGKDSEVEIPARYMGCPVGDINASALLGYRLNDKMAEKNKAVFHVPEGVNIVYNEAESSVCGNDIPDNFTLELVFPSGEKERLVKLYDSFVYS